MMVATYSLAAAEGNRYVRGCRRDAWALFVLALDRARHERDVDEARAAVYAASTLGFSPPEDLVQLVASAPPPPASALLEALRAAATSAAALRTAPAGGA